MEPAAGDLESAWAQTLALAESHLPRPSLETWLRKTRPLAAYNNLIVIATENAFARRMAERHAQFLRERLGACLGRPVELSFVIPESSTDTDGQPFVPPAALPPDVGFDDGASVPSSSNLNPKYSFETFVAAPNSHLTYSASIAVSEAPAKVYNPLFIYGGVGLGKTHLLQAIAHRALARNRTARVAYVSSETFANDLINAIKDRKTEAFRLRYRGVDILLVDDVQFLAGKESTQEEFFHTFNRLYEADKQIVLSSDHPPKEIAPLEERLRSRFEWGLITDIQPPDLETRTAILRKKAELERLPIPNDAIRFIAERIHTNIRELEGALVRVVAYASFHKCPMDEATAHAALRDILPQAQPKQITIPIIQDLVARQYGVTVQDLKIRKRTRDVAFPRQVAMYLARELTDYSLPRIGAEFGGRDHTTVMHACDKISSALPTDAELRTTVAALRARISE